MYSPKILAARPSKDYELLDSGEGMKLERYGAFVLSRPDPQALWSKKLPAVEWQVASAQFVREGKSGGWKFKQGTPKSWEVRLADLKFLIRPSAFKHTGLFPEQQKNWSWLGETIKNATARSIKIERAATVRKSHGREISVLNLFGYTGGATLACASSGAKVCHVDGSKVSINWARENAKLSGLEKEPIRWILDDALAFVRREARRGEKYDGIIMDPPTYGHGPKKEVWQIEKHLPELISECKKILSPAPLFVLINGYASGFSAIAYRNNILELVGERHEPNGRVAQVRPEEIESGELAILESKSGRLLPAGIFARWRSSVI